MRCAEQFADFKELASHLQELFNINGDRLVNLAVGKLVQLRIGHFNHLNAVQHDFAVAFFDLIAARLIEGNDVKISGFGNFQIRTKAPRPGRNPRTGEAIPIRARRVVTFHASHKLKEQIQLDK